MTKCKLSLEDYAEYRVREITLDGTEHYTAPLSLADNYAKLADKLDFNKLILESDAEEKETEKEEPVKVEASEPIESAVAKVRSALPWEGLVTSLEGFLQEVTVLHDLLTLTYTTPYLEMHPVRPVDRPPPNAEIAAQRRASLLTGADLIARCVTRLEAAAERQKLNDFHSQLASLRKYWKIKRVGERLIGEITLGSTSRAAATFEVTHVTTSSSNSQLTVKLPPEFSKDIWLRVAITKEGDKPIASHVTAAEFAQLLTLKGDTKSVSYWHQRLLNAQHRLLCEELFSHLVQQLITDLRVVPYTLLGNRLVVQLEGSRQLEVELVEEVVGSYTASVGPSSCDVTAAPVLAILLLAQLRRFHRSGELSLSSMGSLPLPIHDYLPLPKTPVKPKVLISQHTKKAKLLDGLLTAARTTIIHNRLDQLLNLLRAELAPDILFSTTEHAAADHIATQLQFAVPGFEVLSKGFVTITVRERSLEVFYKDTTHVLMRDVEEFPGMFRMLALDCMMEHVNRVGTSLGMAPVHMNCRINKYSALQTQTGTLLHITIHPERKVLVAKDGEEKEVDISSLPGMRLLDRLYSLMLIIS